MKLARLLHFSDLHFAVGRQPDAVRRIAIQQQVSSVGLPFSLIEQGISGHDPRAVSWLGRSIRKKAAADASWQGLTYLVCTGDLTTWGDDAALASVRKWLDHLHRDTNLPLLMSYGNHDVWPGTPGTIPLVESQARLDARRTAMRGVHFPQRRWLHGCAKFARAGKVIGICSLNTVVHCRLRNTAASGHVGNDFYWDRHKQSSLSQVEELRQWLNDCDVAIVLSHHPVYDPSLNAPTVLNFLGFTISAKALLNADDVAQAMCQVPSTSPNGVRLVLSGHTHAIYPPRGSLPKQGPLPQHGALLGNLGQLTIGSCSQATVRGRKQEQSWELLELTLEDHISPATIVVERTLFVRGNGMGDFAEQPKETLRLSF